MAVNFPARHALGYRSRRALRIFPEPSSHRRMKQNEPSKSRLVFWSCGRRRRLYRKQPFGPFYVRFQFNGKDVPRSLGTSEVDVAIQKAKHLIKATYAGGEHALRAERFTGSPLPKAIADLAIRIPLVTTPAVYFLLRGGQVQYVGQSRNVLRRVGVHIQTKSDVDEIAYVPIPLEKLLEEEARYIRLFRPPLNKKCGTAFKSSAHQLTPVNCTEPLKKAEFYDETPIAS